MQMTQYHDCVPEGNTGAGVLLLPEEDDIGAVLFNHLLLTCILVKVHHRMGEIWTHSTIAHWPFINFLYLPHPISWIIALSLLALPCVFVSVAGSQFKGRVSSWRCRPDVGITVGIVGRWSGLPYNFYPSFHLTINCVLLHGHKCLI